MNDQEHQELQQLKLWQEQLRVSLSGLEGRIEQLEARLKSREKTSPMPEPGLPPVEITPLGIEPLPIHEIEGPPPAAAPLSPATRPVAKTPATTVPPVISPEPVSAWAESLRTPSPATPPTVSPPTPPPPRTLETLLEHRGREAASQATPLAQAPPPLVPGPTAPAKTASFEMRLGTYWLVRIGLVVFLTTLVFAAKYSYQKYAHLLQAWHKVALLYLAGGCLLGVGAWLQRKQDSLKNYGQVLLAGGLAAVYFTTYAAHYYPRLQIIHDPVLAGVLLLAWAGFIVWLADRKKSEVLALFAIGLAYYTSTITRVGHFTLYSNLVLTVAAVFFLVRNRWATLSAVSLAATYAGYAYWRFYQDGDWRWASPEEGLWSGNYFLMSYWIVFTAAVFLSRHESFAGKNRAVFLTANNGAFFALFVLTMIQVRQGGFWKLSLSFGAALVGLSVLARRFLPEEKISRNAYLTQGLVLVTLGFLTYFTGPRLALVLAAESVVLIVLGHLLENRILQFAAYPVSALAVGWGATTISRPDRASLPMGTAIGAVMVFNAWWGKFRSPSGETKTFSASTTTFSFLALVMWLATTWKFAPEDCLAPLLAAEAFLLTAAWYGLRVSELTLFGQLFLVLAQFLCLDNLLGTGVHSPWWNPMLVLAITVGLSHWWQRQRLLACPAEVKQICQGLYALAAVGVLFFWLKPMFGAAAWLAFTCLLALGVTIYGVLTRAWFLAACGQLFLAASALEFFRQLYSGPPDAKPAWFYALAPIATLVAVSVAAGKWLERNPAAKPGCGEPINFLGLAYRLAALVMSLGWIFKYIPERHWVWVLASVGGLFFLGAGWRRNQQGLVASAVFSLAAFAAFWLQPDPRLIVYWPNLLVILFLLGQQQIARRLSPRYAFPDPIHAAAIVLGGCSLWFFVSRWILLLQSGGFYLTVTWTMVAFLVLTAGFVLRERVYRWHGLAVLACALARAVFVDVWRLDTGYRILSFLALSIVLLVLGLIYTKYQAKIREWL